MAHGLNSVLKRGATTIGCKSSNNNNNDGKSSGIGSRRIFAPHFKLQVLDSYRNDADCKGNQRATARKYGIHRRQIQKWLQVENNLRNSVVKIRPAAINNNNNNSLDGERILAPSVTPLPESTLRVARQRDDIADETTSVAAVPQPPSSPNAALPLDFTTHSRGSPLVASSLSSSNSGSPPPVLSDPALPIDLSLKRPTSMAPGALNAPATYCCPPSPLRAPSPPSLAQPHPDVWDLSTSSSNKRKCEDPTPTLNASSAKPIKLFKPYLDDVFDNSASGSEETPKQIASPPCCSSTTCEPYYYNNNNNNCDIKSEYSSTIYTLHELQPTKSNFNYYYTFPSTAYQHHPDYELNGFCANSYDDPNYAIHQHSNSVVPLKQRHSYSLDFKLSAIECYYQDSVCKGNQRAVASKYNIHRRQVQKWLKQADELRQKNENIKQTQTV